MGNKFQTFMLPGQEALAASEGNHRAVIGTELQARVIHFGLVFVRNTLEPIPQLEVSAHSACNDQPA